MPVILGIGGKMEFYCSDKIDVTALFLDALLVLITTGITYFIFTHLPKRRRKSLLSHHLLTLKKRLEDDLLNYEFDFKTSYHKSLGKRLEPHDEQEVQTFNPYIYIPDQNKFNSLLALRFVIFQSFSRTWRLHEIISLLNAMILDDEKFISLSENITELYYNIENINSQFDTRGKGHFNPSDVNDFFTEKNDPAIQYMALERIEETYKVARRIVQIIDTIMKK